MGYGFGSYGIWVCRSPMKNRALEFRENITVRIVNDFQQNPVDNYRKEAV